MIVKKCRIVGRKNVFAVHFFININEVSFKPFTKLTPRANSNIRIKIEKNLISIIFLACTFGRFICMQLLYYFNFLIVESFKRKTFYRIGS